MFRVWDKVSGGSIQVISEPEFRYNTVQDKPRIARVPRTSSIRLVVLIQYLQYLQDLLLSQIFRTTDSLPAIRPLN